MCPELDKMHSNEFINMPSACKTRGFQRQTPLVSLLEIKFKAEKKQTNKLGGKNITGTPSKGCLIFLCANGGQNVYFPVP